MNFLDAVAAGMAVKNAVGTVKGVQKAVAGAKKKREDDEAAVPFPDPQAATDAAGLAALAGGYADEREEDSKPMGNVSTEVGESDEDLYRITSGDEEVSEVTMEDFLSEQAGRDMAAGLAVEDETQASTPVGNTSVVMAEAPTKPQTNNPLIDPTVGARPDGIPIETLSTLFKKTHGGSFDPDSKTDRLKMKVMEDMITEDKSLLGLSPAKFALKVYARK